MTLTRIIAIAVLLGTTGLIGCKKDTSATDPGGKVSLQLNWKPEPQFGGFYAAVANGAFKKQGLEVEITPGGVGTPTVQMVGAGKADFAVVSADEIAIARANGNDVVGLLAVFQDCPQGLMVRSSRGFTSIADIFTHDGTVAMQKGLPYAQLLEKKYGFDKVKVVPSPGGDVTVFLNDEKFAQQCFVTSEPIAANKAGVPTRAFLVKESGYNPYTAVLATRGALVKENPKRVLAMVKACREGWEAYLKDPSAVNATLLKLNPAGDADTFARSAEVQKPLIETDETKAAGLGVMTLARWETLTKQLAELKVIDIAPPAKDCFVDLKALESAAGK